MFPRLIIAIALALIVTTDGLRIVGRQCSRLSSSRLNAGKDKAEAENKPEVKLPEGKDVIRRVLWATTPWIFNSYEDTKNYIDGKKTVKVTVKEEKSFSYRNPEGDMKQYDMKTPGTYNMMDESRAPVVSGSVFEAYSKKAKPSYQVEKVEAPKVVTSTLFGAFNRVASGGTGSAVLGDPSKYPRPRKTLILYEYEGSPFCKRVREAMSMLDLIVEYRPCPSARYGFSDQLATRTSGVRTIPYFVDPSNTIAQLGSISEYDKIVEYLFDNFGPGSENIPKQLQGKISGNAASYTGGVGGKLITNYKQDNIFKKPIDVWGFESSPTLRPVRETLCGLALSHRMVHCAKGSQREGKQQVPYIEDPNTGKKISGSVEIVKYLLAQYTTQ